MPHKLLLADDSVTIQRVIELTFADEDIQVIAVGDGRQAIERIEADRPDIVLADVGMPERDGYEVAAFVKNTPHLAHIPVLLLTGAFEPVDEQRAAAVGCDGVLAKPFEPHMVITRVKELLAGGAGARMPVAIASPRRGLASAGRAASGDGAGRSRPRCRRTPIAVPGLRRAARQRRTRGGGARRVLRPPRRRVRDAAGSRLRHGRRLPPQRRRHAAEPMRPAAEPAAAAAAAAAGQAEPRHAARRGGSPAAAPGAGAALEGAGPGGRHRPGVLGALRRRARRARWPTSRPLIGPAAVPQASVDDLVERVTRQVLERLSDRVVRDTVTDIVSRVAERLVRDEIERVKATSSKRPPPYRPVLRGSPACRSAIGAVTLYDFTIRTDIMSELPKVFDHKDVDARWDSFWESIGAFKAQPESGKPVFSMVLPPPNVTGSLHMGHALNYTLPDILARWKRMLGYDVLWLPGTDHAGIATQNVVEKQLAAERQDAPRPRARGVRSARLGVGEGRAHETITGQMRKLGESVRLVARALHAGRRPVAGGAPRVRVALPRRPDLPRQLHRQLVPALPDGAVGSRGRSTRNRTASSTT